MSLRNKVRTGCAGFLWASIAYATPAVAQVNVPNPFRGGGLTPVVPLPIPGLPLFNPLPGLPPIPISPLLPPGLLPPGLNPPNVNLPNCVPALIPGWPIPFPPQGCLTPSGNLVPNPGPTASVGPTILNVIGPGPAAAGAISLGQTFDWLVYSEVTCRTDWHHFCDGRVDLVVP